MVRSKLRFHYTCIHGRIQRGMGSGPPPALENQNSEILVRTPSGQIASRMRSIWPFVKYVVDDYKKNVVMTPAHPHPAPTNSSGSAHGIIAVKYFYIKDICGLIPCASFPRVGKQVKLSGSCLSTIYGFGPTQLSDTLMSYRCSEDFLTK